MKQKEALLKINRAIDERKKSMIYKENFKIGLKDVWEKEEVSNIALLEYLENIAAYHSDSVGYGVNTTDETNFNWLLLDWKLKIINRPKYGNILTIQTWSRKIEKFYAYRDFKMFDENQNLCAIATSKWVLVDSNKGKITRVTEEMAKKYQSEIDKRVFESEELHKIKEPEKYMREYRYTIQRRDIDVIGHVHNLNYLSFSYETLPEEEYIKRPFNNIRIQYKKELKLGEKIICKYTKIEEKNIVAIYDENQILHAIVEIY